MNIVILTVFLEKFSFRLTGQPMSTARCGMIPSQRSGAFVRMSFRSPEGIHVATRGFHQRLPDKKTLLLKKNAARSGKT